MKVSPIGLRRAVALSSVESLARTLSAGWSVPYLADLPHLRLIDAAFMDAVQGRASKIGIFMPPRHGKSQRLRWCLLWYLAKYPDNEIIIATASQPLAEAHGRWIRDMVLEHGDLLGISLRHDSKAVGRLAINGHSGGLFCTSVGGAGTGMGASIILVDDPVKDARDAESKSVMDTTQQWWSHVATTRLTPDGAAVLMHTRWSDNDLAGRLLSEDSSDWSVVDCPAVAMHPDEYRSLGITDPPPDPLDRQPGEVLDPVRWPAHVLARRRKDVGESAWWALFQQQPRPPSGTLLSRDDINRTRATLAELPESGRCAVAVDPSGGGRDTAGIIGGTVGGDGKVYLTHDSTGVMASETWSRIAMQLAYDMAADTVIVEKNYGGDMARLALRTAWDVLLAEGTVEGLCPYISEVRAKVGKRLRAEPVAQQVKEGRVRFGPGLGELEHEWVRWSPDASFSPGRIDASVYLALHLLPPPASTSRVGNPARPPQPKAPTVAVAGAAPRPSPWGQRVGK